ncbi:hypothetical protein D3C73_1257110 [compost metagenome]
MRNDQLVLDKRISLKEKCITRIGVNDELVYFAQSKVVLHFHFIEHFSEAPVREAGGHAVSPKGVNDVGRANFITHGIVIKAEAIGNFHDFRNGVFKLG